MTNKIEQVLFCYDEKDASKILGFAVQRENRIERLDYNENNWNKIVRELMAAYPSDIEGLNPENENDRNEIVKRFQTNNRIKVVNKDIIVGLTKYESDDVNAKQFEVQYVSGKTRAFGRVDYLDDVAYNTELENYSKEFTGTYGLASGELIKTVNLAKEKNNANPVAPVATPVSRPPVTPRPVGTIKKNSKKIVALAMGGTVLVGSLIGIGYFAGKKKNEVSLPDLEPTATTYFIPLSEITPVPTPIPTPTPTPTSTPTPRPTPTSTPIPTPRPTATPEPIAWRPAPTPFPIEAVNPEDKSLVLRVMTPDLDTLVSFDDLLSGPFDIAGQEYDSYCLNYEYLLQEISNYESSLLSNYLHNNDELPNRAHLVYFENLFADNPIDKAFIQYFSDLRNEIVYQLYRVNDKEKAKECTKFALYQLLRCYINHEPLEIPVNGRIHKVKIEELTPTAQNALKQISYSFYLMQGREKVFFNDSALDYKAIGWNLFGLEPEEEYGSK